MEKYNDKEIFFFVVISCIVMVIGFFYVRDTEEKKEFKIGISAHIEEDVFVNSIIDSVQKEACEYSEKTGREAIISVLYAGGSQRKQNKQIEQFFSLDYDVVCINLVDRTNASQVIDEAQEKGIRLVFFNREPVEQDIFRGEDVYYVGIDSKETAIQQGQAVVDYYKHYKNELDKNGDGVLQYVMLEGEMGHQDTIMRSEYPVKVIESSGIALQKLDGGTADWFRSRGEIISEDWARIYGESIELVLSNNDEMALGAYDALKKANIKAAVFGIDATKAGRTAVENGILSATVDCNAEKQGKYIFQLAARTFEENEAKKDGISFEKFRYIRVPTSVMMHKI